MSDAKEPVTNPELVMAIENARASSTARAWANMVREAVRARFITPVDISTAPRTDENSEKTRRDAPSFSLHMIEDPASGRKLYLAFTDREELSKWRQTPGQRVLVMTFDDYARIVLDGRMASDGFVINPYGGNVVFDRAMIAAIRRDKEARSAGAEQIVMNKGTTVQLGLPTEAPRALIGAISKYLKTQPGVKAAYLQLMEVEGAPRYLVAVDFTGDNKTLFQGISRAAAGALTDLPLDLVSCDSDFWRETILDLEPFYKNSDT